LELDPELLEERGHSFGLLLQVLYVLNQGEHPKFALGKLGPHLCKETERGFVNPVETFRSFRVALCHLGTSFMVHDSKSLDGMKSFK
jgi:hypothetical protein